MKRPKPTTSAEARDDFDLAEGTPQIATIRTTEIEPAPATRPVPAVAAQPTANDPMTCALPTGDFKAMLAILTALDSHR